MPSAATFPTRSKTIDPALLNKSAGVYVCGGLSERTEQAALSQLSSGLKLTQISEPGLRIVGITVRQDFLETFWASSTHSTSSVLLTRLNPC